MIHIILFGKEEIKMSKLISIVICTYNGEKYLESVINEILKQRELKRYVERILIVDNASTDKTCELVKRMKNNNSLIEYVYEANAGLSNARKHAAQLDTEWVAFLDDDNIVMDNWLVCMAEFILKNKQLGVCNSACIAMPEVKFTENELDTLYAVAPGLACTHINKKSFFNKDDPMIKKPFGAGMFVREKELKLFLESGWTNSIGRNKNNLSSGEDGEIAQFILNCGYDYGYNNETAILHIIPHRRIENDYITKLSNGLDKGYYDYLFTNKHSKLMILAVFVKNIILIIAYPIRQTLINKPRQKKRLYYSTKSRYNINKIILKNLFK